MGTFSDFACAARAVGGDGVAFGGIFGSQCGKEKERRKTRQQLRHGGGEPRDVFRHAHRDNAGGQHQLCLYNGYKNRLLIIICSDFYGCGGIYRYKIVIPNKARYAVISDDDKNCRPVPHNH